MNYFDLFSLAPGFDVDKNALSACFRQLQSQYHPDNYAGAGFQEKAIALHKASTINDAYQTLLHPERRAQYMLQLHGIDISNEQQTMQDLDFLMAQMSLREELESLSQSDDPEDAIERFSEKLRKQQHDLENMFVREYEEKQYTQAADSARKMKFYVRLKEQLRALEDNLFEL
ncbi:MAG: Co-chaperone protein HscB [Candidatus Celerinatantimonas neptuna]|nr:MAG: Co-chaperone protein HscB [Candidatus Celerinatantimonas neptuna]